MIPPHNVSAPKLSASSSPPKLILALPAYNEENNLRPLIDDAIRVFTEARHPWQIVVVNDGSTDSTARLLQELSVQYGIQVIHHPHNQGLGAAILTGLQAAIRHVATSHDIIICMDADNTHSPAYILPMVRRIREENYDIVIASRYQPGSREIGVPFQRKVLSRAARLVFSFALNLPEVRDYTCGYRAYRGVLIHKAWETYGENLIQRKGFACTDELLVRLSTLTKRITEIPFTLRYDQKKSVSKLPLTQTIVETVKMLMQK